METSTSSMQVSRYTVVVSESLFGLGEKVDELMNLEYPYVPQGSMVIEPNARTHHGIFTLYYQPMIR